MRPGRAGQPRDRQAQGGYDDVRPLAQQGHQAVDEGRVGGAVLAGRRARAQGPSGGQPGAPGKSGQRIRTYVFDEPAELSGAGRGDDQSDQRAGPFADRGGDGVRDGIGVRPVLTGPQAEQLPGPYPLAVAGQHRGDQIRPGVGPAGESHHIAVGDRGGVNRMADGLRPPRDQLGIGRVPPHAMGGNGKAPDAHLGRLAAGDVRERILERAVTKLPYQAVEPGAVGFPQLGIDPPAHVEPADRDPG